MSAKPWHTTAIAICGNPISNARIANGNGSVILAGIVPNETLTAVTVTAEPRDGQVRTMEVDAYETRGGHSGNWYATSYAICAG